MRALITRLILFFIFTFVAFDSPTASVSQMQDNDLIISNLDPGSAFFNEFSASTKKEDQERMESQEIHVHNRVAVSKKNPFVSAERHSRQVRDDNGKGTESNDTAFYDQNSWVMKLIANKTVPKDSALLHVEIWGLNKLMMIRMTFMMIKLGDQRLHIVRIYFG